MRLLAVDGNSLLNRAYYGIRLLTTKDGLYTNGIVGFMNMLLKIENEVEPDAVAIAFDMKGPTFRHEQFEDYKAHRTGMPDELAAQLPLLKELLGYLGYTIVEKEGWEADDILGTLAETCRNNGKECVIATGDRDSYQLVGDGVTVRLSYTKGGQPQDDIIDEQTVMDTYGVTPKQLIDVKGFMGDPSDNIPGVKGIGEKRALELITKYNSMDEVYENLEDLDITPYMRKNLTEGKEIAYLSRDLSEIDIDAPVDTDFGLYRKNPVDNAGAFQLMSKLELFALMERLGITPEEGGKGEEKVSTPSYTIVENKFDSALLAKKEPLDVLFSIQNNEITEIVFADDKAIYYLTENTQALGKEILTSSRPKRTNHLKSLWHVALREKYSLENITLDAEIAAYILDPTSNDYSLGRLYNEYAVIVPELETELESENLALIAGLTPLANTLAGEIKDNQQEYLLEDIELPLAEVLASMEYIGIALDAEGLKAYGEQIEGDLKKAEEKIFGYAGEEFNVNSPQQLSVILFEKLELPPGKRTKTGYSTNVDVLEGLKDKHPIINEILEYRTLAKLKSTYVDGLLGEVGKDGRIHTTFQQTLTRTGRISSTEPNLQNIPIRTPIGSEIRRFFQAKDGDILLDADYSQIELRVLADLSGDPNMTEAFQHDEDIHTKTASQVFGMPLEMVTPLMRNRAKAVNFGIIYGIGAFSLAQDIDVSVPEADAYIKGYLSYYKGVERFMEDSIAFATEHGYVKTAFERRRYLPELESSNYNLREFGKRVARNMPIQGTAADIIKIAMIRVYRRLEEENLQARLLLQVHDELIVECPPEEIEQASKILQEEMEQATQLSVPLVAEVASGENWLEAK